MLDTLDNEYERIKKKLDEAIGDKEEMDNVSTISTNNPKKGVKLPKFETKCFEGEKHS